MFRKTEILLKTNFKLSTTITVVVEYLKVIDMGPRPTINSLVKRKKYILLFGGIAVKYLDPSDIHIFHIIFFSVRPYRLTHSFIFFFFCFSSSTLLIDDQPTLSLDGELNTRKWSFFFSETGYLNREILPRLRTRHHDILCMISYLCLLNYST